VYGADRAWHEETKKNFHLPIREMIIKLNDLLCLLHGVALLNELLPSFQNISKMDHIHHQINEPKKYFLLIF